MMMTSLVALGLCLGAGAETHEQRNPLYRELRETGLDVGATERAKLPAPICADGLTDKDQQALLKKVMGDEYSPDEFLRNSPLAPFRLRLREVTPAAPKSLTRSVEVVFVAYGDLKTLGNKEFLDRVLAVNREQGKATSLPAETLKKYAITVKDAEYEGYAQLVFNLIDKVELRATGRSLWSKTDHSIIVAGKLDGRFKDDADFANRWSPLTRGPGGKFTAGKASPYDGAGYYVKITQLAQPKGGLLVEGHILFHEPEGWFEGTSLLNSKLPPVLQSQVRSFRRELLKEAK